MGHVRPRALEPLSSDVLLPAMILESEQVDEEESRLQDEYFDKSTLESVCEHLLVKDSKLGVWKFPHASVLEYFETKDDSWVRNALGDVTEFLIETLRKCCVIWGSHYVVDDSSPLELREDRWYL